MNRLVWRIVAAMLMLVVLAVTIVPLAQHIARWRTLAALPSDFQLRLFDEIRPPGLGRPPLALPDAPFPDQTGSFFEQENQRLFQLFSAQQHAQNQAIIIGVAITLVLSVLVSIWLAKSIVRPIRGVSATAAELAAGDLSVRAPTSKRGWPDEATDLARNFNHMADALERYEAGRTAMLADTAHELRNPLAAMQLHIEALQQNLAPLDHEQLAVLQDYVQVLTRLTQDLRLLSLAESQHLVLNKTPADLADVAYDAVRMYIPVAAARGITLALHSTPAMGTFDVVRMQQVLLNLFDNALRVSPNGTAVRVHVGEASGALTCAVVDSGPGILESEAGAVFQRFAKGRRHDTGGSGLGLAIARAIVQLHDGEITVQNEPGAGARFEVRIPA